MSKLNRSAINMKKHESSFQCPICATSMTVYNLSSLRCGNNHTFDLARQGYVNLLTKQIQTNYTKDLFEARREVIVNNKLFDQLTHQLAELIHEYIPNKRDIYIGDMGSGEGSHLHQLYESLRTNYQKNMTGIGIDIAKDGILTAARHYEDIIWLVADLANTPIKDKTFDVILNILSPSNYDEFNRLLTDDGIVIKVIPRKHHLKEIRQAIFKNKEQETYSNEKVINHFKEHFHVIYQEDIQNTKTLDQSALKALMSMTPLTWNKNEDQIKPFLSQSKADITVDLDILIGEKLNVK